MTRRSSRWDTSGEEDGGSGGNPHIWMDPENVAIMLRHITEALIAADPAHATDFRNHQAVYLQQLDRLRKDSQIGSNGLPDRRFIAHHPAWPYLARRFGFDVVGTIQMQSGTEPSALQLQTLISKIKKDRIKVIVSEIQLSQKLPELLAKETKTRVVVLTTLPGGLPGTETYLDMLRYNVLQLANALEFPSGFAGLNFSAGRSIGFRARLPSHRPIIRFDHASFGFPGVVALKDISLSINAGEFVGVIGPNGSGKTTLCKAVLGLMAPVEGHLHIFDCACDELRCHHRAKIGYLPQKGVVDRNFPVTVLETVMMGRYGALGLFKRPGRKDQEIAVESLTHVGMERHETRLWAISPAASNSVCSSRGR